MTVIQDEIKKIVKSLEKDFGQADLAKIQAGLINRFDKGEPLWKAFGLSKPMIEEAYLIAYNKYNGGYYEEAKKLFLLLQYLDEKDLRFRYAVAACFQMEKKYWEAVLIYTQCLALFEPSPLIYYHLADCYTHLNELTLAIAMLRGCIRAIGNNTSYDPLKVRAERLIENLEKGTVQKETVQETKKGR